MSAVSFLLRRFAETKDKAGIIRGGRTTSYGDLLHLIASWRARFLEAGVGAGSVVLLKGDFTPSSIAALLALFDLAAIAMPVTPVSYDKLDEFSDVGEAEFVADTLDEERITRPGRTASHPLYEALRARGESGLVIFSSGSTGKSKGAVHALSRLTAKFAAPRRDFRTLALLLFDHIAGIDTLLYCLSNTSTIVAPHRRDAETICALIAAHGVEVLPAAPSFLNLILMSGAHERHDLSSLKIVTYGSEMMPQSTLERCADAFPHAELIQRYGTSEFGSPPSRSQGNRSRWVKLGGEGLDWRVRDGKLEIKSKSAMMGYLNAPSPFTEDGYFMTGDMVEVDGDYLRFLGRDSDIVNVGGQKVYPAEVEAVIKELDEIAEVAVFGEPSPILGAIVVCRVRCKDPAMAAGALRPLLRKHLSGRLEAYKIPQKILVTHEPLATDRFKQVRR